MNKIIPIALIMVAATLSCTRVSKQALTEPTEVLTSSPNENGTPIQIQFFKGKEYYHPLIVFWVEDTEGKYIETLWAAKSIATGTFRYGKSEGKNWQPGERRRPAALPYWGHRRGDKAPDGLYLPSPDKPLPDAITGATPKSNFVINTAISSSHKRVRVYMEINQTWDWNQYWHNNRFPDDEEYKTSCQPALVYMAEVDLTAKDYEIELKPIGHSHPSGKTSELFPDISNHTTALKIAQRVTITPIKVE